MKKFIDIFQDLFHKQPNKVHFCFANNQRGYARATLTFRYASLTGVLVHAAFFVIFYYINVPEMALFNVFSMLIFLTAVVLLRLGFFYTALNLILLEITTHAIFACYFVGWTSGFNYYIFLLPFGIFLVPLNKHPLDIFEKTFFFLIPISAYLIGWHHLHAVDPVYRQPTEIVSWLQAANLLMFSFAMCIIAMAYGIFVQKAEDALNKEHEKSESLLHNILPVPIAERLKTGTKIIADRFENVSILFLDIVGFTNMSEKVSAQKVVTFLNDLFLIFDDLTEKYNLEKIKTIGDAYMVAGGIPEPCDDHAERIAQMSIDIKNSLIEYNKKNGEIVKVRIGINSGPAVAGVIGRKKFAYDIWGDTVNTASRMESYGEPGEIQVSEATYHLLKDKYDFTSRGVINVKGKGDLPTYFLNC